jgi:hypothetical protein
MWRIDACVLHWWKLAIACYSKVSKALSRTATVLFSSAPLQDIMDVLSLHREFLARAHKMLWNERCFGSELKDLKAKFGQLQMITQLTNTRDSSSRTSRAMEFLRKSSKYEGICWHVENSENVSNCCHMGAIRWLHSKQISTLKGKPFKRRSELRSEFARRPKITAMWLHCFHR